MKIAAIVTVFHPDIDLLFKSIDTYQNAVDKILVWRNSREELLFPVHIQEKIEFCGNGENEYIAKPLNYALDWCLQHEYNYLLMMDQDSTWFNCSDFIKKVKESEEDDVAIYAPNINHQFNTNQEIYNVESVITSGSLCNVYIAKELGGFREDYKIYWVDGEYCFWTRKKGYKIKVLAYFHMDQRFGIPSKTLFGYTTSNYSPIVYYFLFRNMLWMKREYHENPSLKCILYTTFYNVRGIILGEHQKILKIGMICKAFIDGIFGRIVRRESKNGRSCYLCD